ncbi:MAG: hypothetical protein FJ190_05050 [Gammaproteobacteria bacterium]|nr:hypothetical protein [Gammaproteobacteria bacterium]
MDYYELYILDPARHKGIVPAKVDSLEAAEQVYSALSELQPGPNPRFIRLAWHLSKHFPGDDGLPENATDEEIEAYNDMESPIWIVRSAPITYMARHTSALWLPEVNLYYFEEFLSALLPLARQLGLDIYDRQQGFYLPAERQVAFPEKEGTSFRLTYDPEVAKPSLNNLPGSTPVREATLDIMQKRLANQGFEPGPDFAYPFYQFTRKLPRGEQVIQSIVPLFSCNPMLKSASDRFAGLRQALQPDKTIVAPANVFNFSFLTVRGHVQPAWDGLDAGRTNSLEEVEWLLSELMQDGIAILDKARTIKGMDWLYNSDEAATLFPRNSNIPHEGVDQALAAIAYAYWAGNPEFEKIVEQRLAHIAQDNSEAREHIQACADYLRTKEQALGDGVA